MASKGNKDVLIRLNIVVAGLQELNTVRRRLQAMKTLIGETSKALASAPAKTRDAYASLGKQTGNLQTKVTKLSKALKSLGSTKVRTDVFKAFEGKLDSLAGKAGKIRGLMVPAGQSITVTGAGFDTKNLKRVNDLLKENNKLANDLGKNLNQAGKAKAPAAKKPTKKAKVVDAAGDSPEEAAGKIIEGIRARTATMRALVDNRHYKPARKEEEAAQLVIRRIDAEVKLNTLIKMRGDLLARETAILGQQVKIAQAQAKVYKQNPNLVYDLEYYNRQKGISKKQASIEVTKGKTGIQEAELSYEEKKAKLSADIAAARKRGDTSELERLRIQQKALKSEEKLNAVKRSRQDLERHITADLIRQDEVTKVIRDVERTRSSQRKEGRKAFWERKREQQQQDKEIFRDDPSLLGASMPSQQWGAVGKRLVMWTAATTGLWQVVGATRAAVAETINLEFQMAQLQKVMTPGTNFAAMRSEIFNIAKIYGASVTEVAKGAIIWAQQGFSVKATMDLTRSSLLAMNSADLEAVDAVNLLTAAHHTFRIKAEDSRKVIDGIMRVQADYAVTAKDLAAAIELIGPAIRDMGGDINYLNGLVTAVVTVTRKTGNQAAQSIKTIVSRLSDPSVISTFERVGVNIRKNANEYRSIIDVFDELAMKWKELSKGERVDLAKKLGHTRQFVDFLAIMDRYDLVSGAARKSATAFGDAMIANSIQLNTVRKEIDVLGASLTQLAVETIDGQLFKAATLMLKPFSALIGLISKLPGKDIIVFAGALAGLSLAIKAMNLQTLIANTNLATWLAGMKLSQITWSSLGTAIAGAGASLMNFGRTMVSVLTGPMGIIAGVGVAIGLITQLVQKYQALQQARRERTEVSDEVLKTLRDLDVTDNGRTGFVPGEEAYQRYLEVNKLMEERRKALSSERLPQKEMESILRAVQLGNGTMLDLYPNIARSTEDLDKFNEGLRRAVSFQNDLERPKIFGIENLEELGKSLLDVQDVHANITNEGDRQTLELAIRLYELMRAQRPDLKGAQFDIADLIAQVKPEDINNVFGVMARQSGMNIAEFKVGNTAGSSYVAGFRQAISDLINSGAYQDAFKEFQAEAQKQIDVPNKKVTLTPGLDPTTWNSTVKQFYEMTNQFRKDMVTNLTPVTTEGKPTIEMRKREIEEYYISPAKEAQYQLELLNRKQESLFSPELLKAMGKTSKEAVLSAYEDIFGYLNGAISQLESKRNDLTQEVSTNQAKLDAYKAATPDTERDIRADEVQAEIDRKTEELAQVEKELSDLRALMQTSSYKAGLANLEVFRKTVTAVDLAVSQAKSLLDMWKQMEQAAIETRSEISALYREADRAMREDYTRLMETSIGERPNRDVLLASRLETIKVINEAERQEAERTHSDRVALMNEYRKRVEANLRAQQASQGKTEAWFAEEMGKANIEIDNQIAMYNLEYDQKRQILDVQHDINLAQAQYSFEIERSIRFLEKQREIADEFRSALASSFSDLQNIAKIASEPGPGGRKEWATGLLRNVTKVPYDRVLSSTLHDIIPDSIGSLFMSDQERQTVEMREGVKEGTREGVFKGFQDYFGPSPNLAGGVTSDTMAGFIGPTLNALNSIGDSVNDLNSGGNYPSPFDSSTDFTAGLSGKRGKMGKGAKWGMAGGSFLGSLAGGAFAGSQGRGSEWVDSLATVGSMAALIPGVGTIASIALGVGGGLLGGLLGGLFGRKKEQKRTADYVREIAENTSVLKELPQGIFNAPANFTLPPAAYGGSGVSNYFSGNVEIHVYPPEGADSGEIARAVRTELDNAFNMSRKTGAKALRF